MKKLVKKLALSCFALAACAFTLVSTTYAWYTTNTSVEANNISGASADTGAASVFVSANGTDWFQKVDASLAETAKNKITLTKNDKLSPVALNAGKWVDQKGEETAPTFLEFTLLFKTAATTAEVKLAVESITVANTTSSVIKMDNLLTGEEYYQDILPSLAVQFDSSTVTDLKDTGYSLAAGTGGCVTQTTADLSDNAPASAHDYCNEVVPGSVTYTDAATTLTQGLVIAILPADGSSVSVTFRIYLDGANAKCFDACKGQTFNVSFKFYVVE